MLDLTPKLLDLIAALLEERCPSEHQHKIRGFAEFLQTAQASIIPDPYYGGEQGFEHVLDLIEEASDGLMKMVKLIDLSNE
ncbi:hypothetical protein [Limnohabitans sp.]|uniref:arsenate reductase/protein-tyrosine-phosphatase family protein n=1 Tax=Limnohabitans sp. TaxID=1907725 RepID=UPI00286ED54C|nr:hypothetical protein [Limnohabitans sp.]